MFSLPPINPVMSQPPFRKVGPLYCYVEHPKGTIRSGKGWSNTTPADYGYINGFIGADHDELDCYINSNLSGSTVFVVDQSRLHNPSKFDEHKCMLGYGNRETALADYMTGHNQSKKIFWGITELTWKEFMWWLDYGNHFVPIKENHISISSSN